MGRWLRWSLAMVLLAATGGASVVVATAGWKQWWVVIPVGLMVAVIAPWLDIAKDWVKSIAQVRADQHRTALLGSTTVSGRLGKVAEYTDPIRLGVRPAQRLSLPQGAVESANQAAERIPVYVPRDVDAELRGCLATSGFVLLVGDSTAGKTRAAFEAMAATLPSHVLIAPDPRTSGAVRAVLAEAAGIRRCVVWLDDLERFLDGSELTVTGLTNLFSDDEAHRVVISTLREAEYARMLGGAGENGHMLQQDARALVDQAHQIRLRRRFSPGELSRARSRDWDQRIAAALRHADQYGIAEYLSAGPELWNDYTAAQAANTDPTRPTNPRGAALVTAAIDLRRAGYISPIPRSLLDDTHGLYLQRDGGHRLRPEPLLQAWAWATRPRRATTALLEQSDNDTVEVFDYLVDTTQRLSRADDHVPEPTVVTALAISNTGDAIRITVTALDQGRYSLAETSARRAHRLQVDALGADHPDTLTSRNNLALALADQGRYAEAETEHRAVLKALHRVRGAEHPATLTSRNNLALTLDRQGRHVEAEAEHRAVLEALLRVRGAQHPATLTSRNNLALALADQGRYAEAETEHRAVLDICVRVLGTDHPATAISRNHLALVLAGQGRHVEAEAEHRTVLNISIRTLGPEHSATLTIRNNLALALTGQGRYAEAEAEHRAVLEALLRSRDAECPATLTTRNNLALVLSDQDRSAEAGTEHRTVLDISARIINAEHPITLTTSRNNLAQAIAMLRETDTDSKDA